MDSDETDPAPDRAFWLLSDETRIAILRALWAADEKPVSFTDLRERVGNPNSGQFNYHLNKLRDHFVLKADGGYELSQAGREVVRAVHAGSITDQPQVDPAPTDGHCVECGASLVVRYDEYGIIECSDCGETVMWNEFPPAGLTDRTPTEVAETFDEWTRSRFHLAMDGICPNCATAMTTTIHTGTDGDVSTTHQCGNCNYEARAPLFGHVIRHPAVVSFYHAHGIDILSATYWELQAYAREFEEDVVTDDPWTARVTIEADGDQLHLTLDDQLSVVDVEKSTK
jgi:predicted RNA-binding Zn-ribbon protein involved in translation (DUF1610 family)